jgi:hypothetical protein
MLDRPAALHGPWKAGALESPDSRRTRVACRSRSRPARRHGRVSSPLLPAFRRNGSDLIIGNASLEGYCPGLGLTSPKQCFRRFFASACRDPTPDASRCYGRGCGVRGQADGTSGRLFLSFPILRRPSLGRHLSSFCGPASPHVFGIGAIGEDGPHPRPFGNEANPAVRLPTRALTSTKPVRAIDQDLRRA